MEILKRFLNGFLEEIPYVYSLHRVSKSFQLPAVDHRCRSVTAQLCFVLDYTGSMKTQAPRKVVEKPLKRLENK